MAVLWNAHNTLLERLRNLIQNLYNVVHHTLSTLLHYLGKLEVQI